jgi:hypothetical protein
MAHKKGTRQLTERARLERAAARRQGTRWQRRDRRHHHRPAARPALRPGLNAGLGKDDTIFAKTTGRVRFEDHGAHGRVISVLPVE